MANATMQDDSTDSAVGTSSRSAAPEDDRATSAFLPLPHLAFQILLALAAGANHGYGVAKEVERNTDGRTRPGTGSLYLSMAKLRDQGLIAPTEPPEGSVSTDARRRYFRLTGAGRRVAEAEIGRLVALVKLARERDLVPAIKEA